MDPLLHLISFETDITGTGDTGGTGDTSISPPDGGGAAADDLAGAGQGAAASAVPDPPAASAWSPDDPAFQTAVDERAALIAEAQIQRILAEQQARTVQQDDTDDQEIEYPDPFADDYPQQLARWQQANEERLLARMEQLLHPMLGKHQADEQAEIDQRVHDIATDRIADIAGREGDFTDEGKSIVEQLAPAFLGEYERTYGGGLRTVEAALGKAAQLVKQIEKAAEKRGIERYKNEMHTISGARPEPSGGSLGVQGAEPASSLMEIGARFAAQQGAR